MFGGKFAEFYVTLLAFISIVDHSAGEFKTMSDESFALTTNFQFCVSVTQVTKLQSYHLSLS